MKLTVAAAAGLVCIPLCVSAQTTSTGLTGLGEMRTPDTIPGNGSELTVVPFRYSAIEETAGGNIPTVGSRLIPSLSYTQGWGQRFEASVQVPFLMHDYESGADSGLGNIPVAAKFRFLEWSVFRFAVDAEVEVPAGEKGKYGSGTPGVGADFLTTVDAGPVVLAGSVGYGTQDYCPKCTFWGAQLPEPRSVPVVEGALGVSYASSRGYGAFAEVHGSKANNGVKTDDIDGDPDLYALIGGRLPVGKRITVTAYGGAGFHEASNTDTVGAVMLSYNFSGARPLSRTSGAVAAATPKPTPIATPKATPVAIATPVATPTPVPTPIVVVVARPTPTPVPTPVNITLTASQIALRDKLKAGAQFILDGVQFQGVTANLEPSSNATIGDLGAVLVAHPELKLRVESHVDPTDPGPIPLSKLRAETVATKLISIGANPAQLEAKGMGGSKSLFPSFVEAMKAKNRRVEIAVLSAPVVTATAVPTPTPVLVQLNAAQSAVRAKMKTGETFLLEGVAFQGMTDKLTPGSTKALSNFGAVLKAHPEARVRIEAHMDPTDKNPVAISQKRAEAVIAKLVSWGVNSGQLEAKGMGGSKSLFPSFVDAMKAKNRRIEVAVVAAPAQPAATPAATGPRVKVLASKGRSGQGVKLANMLKQGGTNVTMVASVPEARPKTVVYYLPQFKNEAIALSKVLGIPNPKLAPSRTLGAGIDIVILVGADAK